MQWRPNASHPIAMASNLRANASHLRGGSVWPCDQIFCRKRPLGSRWSTRSLCRGLGFLEHLGQWLRLSSPFAIFHELIGIHADLFETAHGLLRNRTTPKSVKVPRPSEESPQIGGRRQGLRTCSPASCDGLVQSFPVRTEGRDGTAGTVQGKTRKHRAPRNKALLGAPGIATNGASLLLVTRSY